MEKEAPIKKQELQVELVETTSVLNKKINLNCTFDGSNLIYLAGSNIVFHNIFQNLKHFQQRLNDYPVLGMAFQRNADVSIAIITRVPSPEPLCLLEFYHPDCKPTVVELHEDMTVYDAVLLEKNKIGMLCEDYIIGRPMLLIVSSHRKLKRVQLEEPLLKFNIGDHRLLLTKATQGCVQLNMDTEEFGQNCYQDIEVKEVINLDETQIVVTRHSMLHVFVQGKQIQELRLEDYRQGEWGTGLRVGRHIVFSFKGQLTLGYFQWSEGRLKWVGCFEYSERVRANIICMQSSPDEMNMVLAVQIFHKDSWIIEHFMFNLAALCSQKKFINAFTRLAHNGAETGDCVSMQRVIASQIFLLSGPSIVNYSYVDSVQKKHKYTIHQSPRLIALHPLGYQILCTFQGAVKFYQKVEMDLTELWTEPWACTAAKYTDSGLLLLSIFDEGSHQIILYNPNSFTKVRSYSNIYLKHAITAIEIDDTQTDMALWSNKDVSVYRIKTGEKLSQFREKRQGFQANCVQYDSCKKQILVGMNKKLSVCRKTENYHLNFSQQKHMSTEQNITCIILRQSAHLAFMGTSSGKVLFCNYPFEPKQSTVNNQTVLNMAFRSVRVHSCPTTDLLLSNNGKYLFASSKGQGLAILKVRKHGGMGHFYNPFDISNYNFIETSTKPYLQTVQERLKNLLQKRKAIFNELDEFKKEWQGKRHSESKARSIQQKKTQLDTINQALEDISIAKKEQQQLTAKLTELKQLQNKVANEEEKENHAEMLVKYGQNDKLKDSLQITQQKCKEQYLQIQQECQQNLKEIQNELKVKFNDFEDNYKQMKANLLNFALRTKIQEQQQSILGQKQIENTRAKLRKEEDDLLKKNNELKSQITRNKKQMQRYLNRKDFLQNKQRFFSEELKFCSNEQTELNDIKDELQQELKELQAETQKKQKKLRKYFIENQSLTKYQLVHGNLTKTTERQTQFYEKQSATLRSQINQIQKQLLAVSQGRTGLLKDITQKQSESVQAKNDIKQLKARSQYLELQIKELQRLLSTVTPGRQNDLQGLYERFFVKKRLEGAIEGGRYEDKQREQTKKVEIKIKEELKDHKNYLVTNMQMFQKGNAKVFNEIQQSYMKYQSQNYALIGQCNNRKEQMSKKKKTFQQMVNSMRQTQNCIQKMQNGTYKPSPKKVDLEPRVIPFAQYEKQNIIARDSSEPSLHKPRNTVTHVRKMLDVQKCSFPESRVKPIRRIQTAQVKKQVQESNHEQAAAEDDYGGWFITKPPTASRKARGAQQEARRLFSRSKSRSKPTTCTSHTKFSVFI